MSPKKVCMIINKPNQGGIVFDEIENPPGLPRRYKNTLLWVATRDDDNKLVAYVPSDTVVKTPEELNSALNCPWARRLLAHRNTMMEKANLVLGIAAIGVLLLAIVIAVDLI